MFQMRRRTKGDAQRGFSLVEVLVAMVVLTVGLLSLAQLMLLATNSNALSSRMTSTAALAREQMERLKALPYYSNAAARTINPQLLDGGSLTVSQGNYFQDYDANGQPVAPGQGLIVVRWTIRTRIPPGAAGVGPMPLAMLEIQVRSEGANPDNLQFLGRTNLTTFRSANIG
jgi:type IV pilus modification protein PilV